MWKKIVGIICLMIFFCGCEKSEFRVETVVEESNNTVITINTPITGIKQLDDHLLQYVKKIEQRFRTEYSNFYSNTKKSELNIDYHYEKIGERYHNVILYTFIDNSSFAHPINEIQTFVYDEVEHKMLTLNHVLDEKGKKKLIPILQQKLIKDYEKCLFLDQMQVKLYDQFGEKTMFQIDDKNLTIYFNPYSITAGACGIVKEQIPISSLQLKIPMKKTEKTELIYYQSPQKKSIDPEKPIIALTFDDGPSKYTKSILELLKENDSSATFFVLGNKVESYSETIRKMIEYGNEIGNHTYNHKWLNHLSKEELNDQIEQTQSILNELFHYKPRLFRPSYGSREQNIRDSTDLEFVFWTLDSNDWRLKNSKKIINRVLKQAKDGDIILFHDLYPTTYEALKKIIPALHEEGFQLVTVSEWDEIQVIRGNKK